MSLYIIDMVCTENFAPMNMVIAGIVIDQVEALFYDESQKRLHGRFKARGSSGVHASFEQYNPIRWDVVFRLIFIPN